MTKKTWSHFFFPQGLIINYGKEKLQQPMIVLFSQVLFIVKIILYGFNLYNNRHMLSQRIPMHFGNRTILAQLWAKPCSFCTCTVVTMPLYHCSDTAMSENGLEHWQIHRAALPIEDYCSGIWCMWAPQDTLLCQQQVSTHFNKPFPSPTMTTNHCSVGNYSTNYDLRHAI